jgi:hypothetical protein
VYGGVVADADDLVDQAGVEISEDEARTNALDAMRSGPAG